MITSTAAVTGIVLSWVASTADMIYFTRSAIPTIGLEVAKFRVIPIFVYILVFLRAPNSTSIAEWVVQKIYRLKDDDVPERYYPLYF